MNAISDGEKKFLGKDKPPKLTPYQARLAGFLVSGHKLWYNTSKRRYQVGKETIREDTVDLMIERGYLKTGETLPSGSFRLLLTDRAKREIRK